MLFVTGLYSIAFLGNARIFLIFFLLAYFFALIVIVFGVCDLLFLIAPPTILSAYRQNQWRYRSILVVLSFFVLLWLRYFYYENFSHAPLLPFKLLAICILVAFLILTSWNFFKNRTKAIFLTLIVFVSFNLFLLSWYSLKAYSKDEAAAKEELASLPYATWVSTKNSAEKSGVTLHQSEKSFPGVNLYCPDHLPEAFLFGMDGKVLHHWKARQHKEEAWSHVEVDGNGDILAIFKDHWLTRIGWDSKVQWRTNGRFHHDVRIVPGGNLYALVRRDDVVFIRNIPVPILNDGISILSPEGKVQREYFLFGIYKNEFSYRTLWSVYRELIFHPYLSLRLLRNAIFGFNNLLDEGTPFDILHSNSIEFTSAQNGGFQKGNLLLSMRRLHLVSTLDPQSGKITWQAPQDMFLFQHHPTLLENGNVLLFDNGMLNRRFSRILEINPQTNQVVWEYKGKPATSFYSKSRGGNQRLQNGNTLITESDKGHAFEVTKTGEIVWEFYTTHRKENKRAAMFRVLRFSDPEHYSFLRELLGQTDEKVNPVK